MLAARLSEDPERTVCLVEAGPDYGPVRGWRLAGRPARRTRRRSLALVGDRPGRPLAVEGEGDRWLLGAQRLRRDRGTAADYDEWGPGWTHAKLEPYLERAARELRTRRFLTEEVSPWHRAFAEAAGEGAFVHPANAVGTVR